MDVAYNPEIDQAYLAACIGRISRVPKWLAKMFSGWHRWKAAKLAASVKEQQRAVQQVMERAAYHEPRAKHWDFLADRRRR